MSFPFDNNYIIELLKKSITITDNDDYTKKIFHLVNKKNDNNLNLTSSPSIKLLYNEVSCNYNNDIIDFINNRFKKKKKKEGNLKFINKTEDNLNSINLLKTLSHASCYYFDHENLDQIKGSSSLLHKKNKVEQKSSFQSKDTHLKHSFTNNYDFKKNNKQESFSNINSKYSITFHSYFTVLNKSQTSLDIIYNDLKNKTHENIKSNKLLTYNCSFNDNDLKSEKLNTNKYCCTHDDIIPDEKKNYIENVFCNDDDSSLNSFFSDAETDYLFCSNIYDNSFSEFKNFFFSNSQMNNLNYGLDVKKMTNKKKNFDLKKKSSISDFDLKMNVMKKPSLNFEKILPKKNPTSLNSNLSKLIQTQFKSVYLNPLNYFSFVNSETNNLFHKTSLDIFLTPIDKPIIKNLSINDKIMIFDCIGYILLILSKNRSFCKSTNKINLFDPNYWRLELVDDDGENYGAFGILDRSRSLSSYNNPKELALCEISDKDEIEKNIDQTPLPKEFKKNLLTFQNKYNFNFNFELNCVNDNVNLKILTSFEFEKTRVNNLNISSQCKLEEITKDFCCKNNLNPKNYKLIKTNLYSEKKTKSFSDKVLFNDQILNTKHDFVLYNDVIAKDLTNTVLKLIPINNSFTKDELITNKNISQDEDFFFNSEITSFDSSFKLQSNFSLNKNIDQQKKMGKKKTKELIIPSLISKNSVNISNKNVFRSKSNCFNINNSVVEKNDPQFPTNLNTIYFKWNVWRKKTSILNKLEKSFIIDGDYIHLTPCDDLVFKKKFFEPSFLQNIGNHDNLQHNYHHLYYYYRRLIMKTSSFHITLIIKLKQSKNDKNSSQFKILVNKQVINNPASKNSFIKKKYHLEAVDSTQCQEILEKLKFVLKVYNMTNDSFL